MNATRASLATAQLTPTSYLVLGLIAREGPSTPYDLKRHVTATIGHFWSFPHALLYKEPQRLKELGLLTEEREADGRRRRLFSITARGRQALRSWLARPAQQSTELRDLGLLQLFFADLEPVPVTRAIAREQLVRHQAQLAAYEAGSVDGGSEMAGSSSQSVEHWRGVTLRMGLLYERAAVEFWSGLVGRAPGSGASTGDAQSNGGPARAGRAGPGRDISRNA